MINIRSIKQFIKPSWGKIILVLIVFIFLSTVVNILVERPLWCGWGNSSSGPCGKTLEAVKIFEAFLFIFFDSYYKIPFQSIITIILLLILSYLTSSVMIFAWNKIKEKCPESIKQVLMPVKWGRIIAFVSFSFVLWIIFIFSSTCMPAPCVTNEFIILINLIFNFIPNIFVSFLTGSNSLTVRLLVIFIIPLAWYYFLYCLLFFAWDKIKGRKTIN